MEWSSHQCSDGQTQGKNTLIGAAVSFTITELRADTEYNILVTAYNSAGNFTSNVLTERTLEMSKGISGIFYTLQSL